VGLKAATALTVSEVLAQDKSVHTFTRDYMSLTTDDNIRVYHSQPLCGFLDGESFAVENIIIKIADFGKAFLSSDGYESRQATGFGDRSVMAPEVIAGCPWDYTADVWSLGASIWELATSDPLFESNCISNDDLLLHMVETCGDLPEYIEETPYMEEALKDCIHYRGMPYKEPLITRIFNYMPALSGPRTRVFVDFLSSMLQMDSRERVSLADLLCHRWLSEEIGFPTYPCKCGVLLESQATQIESIRMQEKEI